MSSLYWKTTELEVCIVDLIFFVRLTSKLHGVFYAFLSQNWRVPEPLTVRSSLLHMPTETTEPLLSCYLLIAWVRECPSCTSLQWDAGGVVSLNLLWKSCSSEEMCRETSFLALHHWASEEMCRDKLSCPAPLGVVVFTWSSVLQQLSYHPEGAKPTSCTEQRAEQEDGEDLC